MKRLPLLRAQELARILIRMGFEQPRKQRGSHMFFRHPDGRTTLIPNHPGERIDRRLLNKVLRKDLQVSREEFERHF